MGTFLYFIPGAYTKKQVDAFIASAAPELKKIFDPKNAKENETELAYAMTNRIDDGPLDSGSGVIINQSLKTIDPSKVHQKITHLPNSQTWVKYKNYYVGMDNDFRPTPEDLIRPEGHIIPGHATECADGHKWMIPLARIINGSSGFPAVLNMGDDGEITEVMLPKFKELKTAAERIWHDFRTRYDWIEKDEEPAEPIDIKEGFTYCVDFLNVNYRLYIPEVNLLGLISNSTYGDAVGANVYSNILQAVIDIPTIIRISKEQSEANGKKNIEDTCQTDVTTNSDVGIEG